MGFRADMEAAEEAARPRWHLVERDVTASLDGTHQLHRFVGRWGGGEVGEWTVLIDAATGEALLDMARVRDAKVAWRADGALLIRMARYADARLIIVDPDIRAFRDIGIDTAPRPVAELQGAVATAAYELGADGGNRNPRDAYLTRDFSPNGEMLVEYDIVPQRMSHETRVPRLIDAASGDVLLTLPNALYDGAFEWKSDGTAWLVVRHYDGGGTTIIVDYRNRAYARWSAQDDWLPLSGATRDIDRLVKQSRKPTALRQDQRGPLAIRLLAIALVIAFVLGVIALAAWSFTDEPQQNLTELPKFPVRR